jgi:hypothetical protein
VWKARVSAIYHAICASLSSNHWGTIVIVDETILAFTFWITCTIASALLIVPIVMIVKAESLAEQMVITVVAKILTPVCLM